MKKITIAMEEEVVQWARMKAALRGISLSRFVSELLREKMLSEETWQAARQQYLSHPPKELKRPEECYPKRQELYKN